MTDAIKTTAGRVTRPRRARWPWVVLFVVILLGIATPVAWNNGVREALFPKNFGVVEPGRLYRSGQISHWQVEKTLRKNDIKVIVALSGSGGHRADLDAEAKAVADLGIDRQVFPLGGDGTGQIEEYAQAIAAVDKAERAGKPVLVHCIAGAQRTGGVIAMYELLVEHRPVDEADRQLKQYGHDPHDNPKLIPYLNSNMQQLADRLVQLKVIPKPPDPLPLLPVD
jgi:protein tyrosine/serine phosphatase